MATHSSILAWRIPWREKPGRLQSMGSQRVDSTELLHFHFHFKVALVVKNLLANAEDMRLGFNPWVGKVSQHALAHDRKSESFGRVSLLATPWAVVCQAPLSTGLSKQKSWSGLVFIPPGDLPHPGIEPRSPALQEDSLPSELPGKPRNCL